MQRVLPLLLTTLRFLFKPIRESFIDLKELSWGLRILVILGYLSVFFLLALMLIFDVFRNHLTLVTYVYHGTEDAIQQVPFVVLIVGALCFVLGWAYIITGATDCRCRIFLPIVGVFAVQLFLFLPVNDLMFLWFCTAPLLVMALVGIYFFTHRKRVWRDFPLVEFAVWFCAMAFFVGLAWVSRPTVEDLAEDFGATFSFLSLLNMPLWVLLGLGVIDAAVGIARFIVVILRRLFPGEVLRALAVFFVLARPAAGILTFSLGLHETTLGKALFADAFISAIPLTIVLVVVALARRWNTRNAVTVMALSFVSLTFILGLVMTMQGMDLSSPLELVLGGLNIFPPLLLFVLLMAANVLGVGASFANQDGRIIPRSGRVPLVFGFALLAIALTMFSVSVREADGRMSESFQTAFNSFFGLSVYLLGLPYLGWIIWRRRSRLTGDEAEFEGKTPVFAWLGRAPGRLWLVLVILLAVLLVCLACVVVLVIYNPTP